MTALQQFAKNLPIRVLILSALVSSAALAKLEIYFNENNPALNAATEQLAQLLPQKIKAAIDKKIEISFSDFGNPKLMPVCPNVVDLDPLANTGLQNQIRGKTRFPFLRKTPYKIIIHSKLKEALLQGESKSQTYDCGHRNFYRLAIATLVHEIGHIYDHLALKSKSETAEVAQCDLDKLFDPQMANDIECLKAKEYERTISSRKSYQMLAGIFSGDNKNILRFRSPDPYEFKDAEESFAVNLEYFILDPEYKCRKPAMYRYLSEQLDVKNNTSTCQAYNSIFLSSSRNEMNLQKVIALDPSRIYQIHYLLADKGTDMSSRWGHAMLRLIVCAPERQTVGPECMQDLSYHLVVSFRANVSDIVTDYRKGLLGGYPSKMYIYPLSDIVEEYNYGELRDLKSVPINLSETQKELFINRILEIYWGYAGKYYFISNNCATETHDLIRSILNIDDLTYHVVYKPIGLFDDLQRFKVTDASVLDDEERAIQGRYLFLSQAVNYQTSADRLRAFGVKISNWKNFEEELSPEERRAKYLQAIQSITSLDAYRKISANFYLLERYAQEKIERDTDKKIYELISQLDKMKETDSITSEQRARLLEFKKYLKESLKMTPLANLKPGSYGVPLATDFYATTLSEKPPQFNEKLIEAFVDSNFKDLVNIKAKIQDNIQLFKKGSLRVTNATSF